MPLTLPKPSWVADEDFLAEDITGDMTAITNKFSETGGVGIGDGDVATDAGISALKLSNASGKQIPEDRIADDAVTAAKLRDSTSVDANRAVTTDHLRDLSVTKGKVKIGDLTQAQMALATQSKHLAVSVGGSVLWSIQLEVTTSGGNYRVKVHTMWNGSFTGARVDNVDPTTPIAVSGATILGVYLSTLTTMGASTLDCDITFVWLVKT